MLHKTEQQIEIEISDPKASLGNAELYVFSQYKPPARGGRCLFVTQQI